METLCKVRDIYRSIADFEANFERIYGLCLNEGMLLCSLSKAEKLTSGEIAGLLGLATSHTSKVIAAVEKKGFIERLLGERDRRQMYFSLSEKGKSCIGSIMQGEIEIPEALKSMLKLK